MDLQFVAHGGRGVRAIKLCANQVKVADDAQVEKWRRIADNGHATTKKRGRGRHKKGLLQLASIASIAGIRLVLVEFFRAIMPFDATGAEPLSEGKCIEII